MDHSKLSDFEINSAVHNALLREPYSLKFLGNDRIMWQKKNDEYITTEKVNYTKNGVHDYCNNPADAWPIIVEHHIAVVPYRHTLPQAWPTAFGLCSKFTTEDTNPLRAAMIVFLMMQENK